MWLTDFKYGDNISHLPAKDILEHWTDYVNTFDKNLGQRTAVFLRNVALSSSMLQSEDNLGLQNKFEMPAQPSQQDPSDSCSVAAVLKLHMNKKKTSR